MLGRREQAVLVGVLAATFALLYIASAGFRGSIEQATSILVRGDVQGLKEYLLSFGVWAPVISGALMVLQSIAAPLPAFVITFANGLLFGAFWGAVLSWSSAMVGAAVCYFIAKALGRPVLERVLGVRSLRMADSFFERYGRYAVLIARLVPVISFDIVSYAAGVTSIGFVEFMVATGVGQLPATVVYSFLGENLTGGAKIGLWALGGVIALLVLALAVKAALERKLSSGGPPSRRG